MIDEYTDFVKLFDKWLLRDISICIPGKTPKTGKLKMLSARHNVLKFTLENNGSVRAIDLYYPFGYTVSKNEVVFSYALSQITKNNAYLQFILNSQITEETDSILNQQIRIKKI